MFEKILHKINTIRRAKAAILLYHQVCERKNDPWELAVNPNHFYEQLNYLKNHYNIVSLDELTADIAHNKIKAGTIAITFDDGFKDNYTNAAPLLDWHELPATFYIATTAMEEEKFYWWDELQDILFQSEVLPPDFAMLINNEWIQFSLASDRMLNRRLINQMSAWNYYLPIPNERIALYMILWQRIKPLPYHDQKKILRDIKSWAGMTKNISIQSVTMDIREMQMLSQNPLFSIGAHTVHHAMLSEQNEIDQAFEVKESKRQIESWLGKPVDGFAYPYGNYNAATQSLLKEAGFRHAVSTESKLVTTEDDPFALPRIQVKNWCVYEFASKINQMVN